ncbi:MAG TPA: hypothetical protein VL284_14115, partial [Thermoanaerobaculia bacterium]|nr:hypothetical protein [Thermoanaerobaculia bacterium]
VPLFENDPPAMLKPAANGIVSVPVFKAVPLFTAIVPGHKSVPPLGLRVSDPPLTVNDVVLRIAPPDSIVNELPAGISNDAAVGELIERVTALATGTLMMKFVPSVIAAVSAVDCPG